MSQIKSIILLVSTMLSLNVFTKGTIVAVGKAELEKENLIFSSDSSSKSYLNIIKNDFSFYKKLFVISKKSSGSGKRISIKKSGNELSVSMAGKKTLSYSLGGDLREVSHQISHDLYKELTGKGSIFKSKIIFVSDRDGVKANNVKEIYQMDFDGGNLKRLTFHKGTVISPALSQDGSQVLYSLIKNSRSKKRNNDLYLLNMKTGQSQMISSRKGINSGAVFMPGGKEILLTLSHQGNAELYAMNLATKKIRRVTKNRAPDVDPSVNVRGNLMTFLSGRSGLGKPMVYIADPRAQETSVKRVSFVGRFNATPRFSPDGSEIAFSSWLDNRFDLFRIDSNGANIARLTKDFGSNEDPSYSNDGQFIAFSSQRVISRRKAVQNIYIMDRDGDIWGQITKNIGNCSSPRWSKSL